MSTSFPPVVVHITTDSTGSTSFLSPITPPTPPSNPGAMQVNYIYCTPPPLLTLKNDDDLSYYHTATSSTPLPSFPAAGATISSVLDFPPNPEGTGGKLHRTQTLDHIFIMEGELELTLDNGQKKVFKKGDVIVQRAAMHAWRNVSATEGARMATVMMGIEGAVAGAIEMSNA